MDDPSADGGAVVLEQLAHWQAEYFPGIRPMDPLWRKGEPPEPSPGGNRGGDSGGGGRFTFAEIFAGIGGFRLGLEPLGGRCVLAAEIDVAAAQTYCANFPDPDAAVPGGAAATAAGLRQPEAVSEPAQGAGSMLAGDITEYGSAELPPFDLLTAGFPCQVGVQYLTWPCLEVST
jgi:DNA (cytosine-5)-methyltransferase 1